MSAATGWADDRLMEAFNLVEEVMDGQHPEADAHGMLKKIRDLIEDADMELERPA